MTIEVSNEIRYPQQAMYWAQQNKTDKYEAIPTRKVIKDGEEIQLYKFVAIIEEQGDMIVNVHSMWDLLEVSEISKIGFNIASVEGGSLNNMLRRSDYLNCLMYYEISTGHRPNWLIRSEDGGYRPINPTWEKDMKELSENMANVIMNKYNDSLD